MILREIQDNDNVRWQCVEAYSAVAGSEEILNDSMVTVVCTPSGGAQTVRLQLQKGWNESLSDEDLSNRIKKEG